MVDRYSDVAERIDSARNDPEFMARLDARIKNDAAILDKLATK